MTELECKAPAIREWSTLNLGGCNPIPEQSNEKIASIQLCLHELRAVLNGSEVMLWSIPSTLCVDTRRRVEEASSREMQLIVSPSVIKLWNGEVRHL